jgi:hypothetical protein
VRGKRDVELPSKELSANEGARILEKLVAASQEREIVTCTSTSKTFARLTYSFAGGEEKTVVLETDACDPDGAKPALYLQGRPDAARTNGGDSRAWSVIRVCEEVLDA